MRQTTSPTLAETWVVDYYYQNSVTGKYYVTISNPLGGGVGRFAFLSSQCDAGNNTPCLRTQETELWLVDDILKTDPSSSIINASSSIQCSNTSSAFYNMYVSVDCGKYQKPCMQKEQPFVWKFVNNQG